MRTFQAKSFSVTARLRIVPIVGVEIDMTNLENKQSSMNLANILLNGDFTYWITHSNPQSCGMDDVHKICITRIQSL